MGIMTKEYHNAYQQGYKDAKEEFKNTIRKYQSIEKIINAPIGGTSAKYNAIVNLIKYSEVDNGDDD